MAHVFVLAEARECWMNAFIIDLTERRYQFRMANGKLGFIQPNIREVKLFDISVPEQCVPSLMADLSPFAKDTSRLRGLANLFAKLLRKVVRLRDIYDTYHSPKEGYFTKLKNYIFESLKLKEKPKQEEYQPTFEIRKRWVNIIPIGWAEDKFVPDADERPTYPAGREKGTIELI